MATRQDPLSGRFVPPPADEDHRSPDEIRQDIRRERDDLDRIIDALERKLSPGNLADELWAKAKSKLGDGGTELAGAAKEHPIPLAMIGAGLGWLLIESTTGRSVSLDRHGDGAGHEQSGPGMAEKLKEKARDAKDSVQGAVQGAGEKASEWRGKASEWKETSGEAAGQSRERLREAGESAREKVRGARRGFWDTMESNPFGIGTAAFGLGVLTGLSLPSTRVEDELMGETRDQLFEKAEEAGRKATHQGAEAARDSARAATDTMRDPARRDQPMGERLKAAAQDAGKEAKRKLGQEEEQPEEVGAPRR